MRLRTSRSTKKYARTKRVKRGSIARGLTRSRVVVKRFCHEARCSEMSIAQYPVSPIYGQSCCIVPSIPIIHAVKMPPKLIARTSRNIPRGKINPYGLAVLIRCKAYHKCRFILAVAQHQRTAALLTQINKNRTAAPHTAVVLELQARGILWDFKPHPARALAVGDNRAIKTVVYVSDGLIRA